jgi:outer membrane protein OmpA-like peptidoglycan-associated protein
MDPRGMAVGVLLAAALAGCAAADSGRRAKAGATVGAAGAAATGKPLVPAVGAIAETAVAHYMDRQADELQRELAVERARQELQIVRLPGHALKLSVAGDSSFNFNSAEIKPDALGTYAKIAAVLLSHGNTVVHIVCHTDATGSDPYNQDLSQRRAAALAAYMGSRGMPGTRVRSHGRGESEPIGNNNTAEGRKRNRRVDIVIKPVIEGQQQQAWTPPPDPGA